jgi:sugar phosphate isomerase/epimerase
MIPHEVTLDLIASLGFEGHDISLVQGDHGVLSLDQVRQDIDGWAGRLDERIRGRGLEIADLAAWADYDRMSPNHPDSEQRKEGLKLFRDVVKLATRLRVTGITMVPGTDWPGETHDESLARAGAEMQRRAVEAAAAGVRFSIEPHVGSVCRSPADVLRLCELAPDLRLTLDYSHYTSQGFTDAELEPLVPFAAHVHMRGGADGRLQTSMEHNTIDHESVVDLLASQGYEGFIAVEYVWISWGRMNEVDVLSETVMLRDRLRAKLAGEAWSYPHFDWPIDTVANA